MTSFTDARGNTTQFDYDSTGNLLRTQNPDGSFTELGSYTLEGLPQTRTNARDQTSTYTYTASGRISTQDLSEGGGNPKDSFGL